MASRPNTAGSRAISGLGKGLSEVGDEYLTQSLNARAEQRRASLAVQKELEDKVAAGTLEPEQAAQIASARGIPRDQKYFESLQPSHENQLKGIITGMGKAGSLQEVPTPEELSYRLPGGPSKSMAIGPMGQPQQANLSSTPIGDGQPLPDLPSTATGPVSTPDMQTLLNARTSKINSFPGEATPSTDQAGNKTTEYPNPAMRTGRTYRPEPTAEQAGVLTGLKNALQTKTENAQGLPQAKGQAYTAEHLAGEFSPDITKAKVGQQGAVSTAEAQAQLNVNSSPQALALAKKKAEIEAGVKQAFAEQGLTPEFAQSFVHQSAWGPYYEANLVQSHTQGQYITRAIAQAQKNTGTKIAPLDTQGANALSVMQRAYENFNYVADTMAEFASKSASSRAIGGPANTLAVAMQTNPTLAAMVTSELPAVMEAAGAQMQGLRGMRMGKDLVESFKAMGPQPTDTLAVIRRKQLMQAQFLTNAANSLLK